MKYIDCTIAFALFFAGCASGRLSLDKGDVRFAIPFDFPQPQQQEETLREEAIAEQMQQMEKHKAQEGAGTQK